MTPSKSPLPAKEWSAQPQPSLRGRNAWVLDKLLTLRGTNPAEVAAWIIDQWIDGQGRDYLKTYNIDLRDFCRGGDNVIPIDPGRNSS